MDFSLADKVDAYIAFAAPYIERWGLLAVGAGILCETLLFAGVFIPGFSILVAAGFLAAGGTLNPVATLGTAWAGGVAGDQLCYLLGRWLGERFTRRHGPIVDRLRYALEHEGVGILLWYHYVSPMRIVMPYVAGSFRYSRRRWLLYDSLGVLLWVCFGFGIGYFSHGPLRRFGDAGYLVVMAVVALMVLFTVWRFVKVFRRREQPPADPGGLVPEPEEADAD